MDSEAITLPLINPLNLRAQIENEVREAILQGAIKPGQRLIESSLANRLGVSRAPVREVLIALEREGLVINIPRRGNFVVSFTEKDIDEIYSLRLILEIGAVRRAILRVNDVDLQNMQAIVNHIGEATHNHADQLTQIKLDLSFHEYINRLADHQRMSALLKGLRTQIMLLIGLTSQTHTMADQPMVLHQQILDALKDRDVDEAEKILTAHILDAQNRAIQSLSLSNAILNGLN